MFSLVSVILSTWEVCIAGNNMCGMGVAMSQGNGACMAEGGMCGKEGMHGMGCVVELSVTGGAYMV